jgi:hypothetical protein
MNAQAARPTTPAEPGRARASVGLWVALAALAVGLAVAVLGIRASVASYVRGQEIEDYATARATAGYFTEGGDRISRSMRQLGAYNRADLVDMRQMRDVLAVGDSATYNALVGRMNARSGAQATVWSTLVDFQEGFDRATR